MRVAVPTALPGGLESPISGHFGHSEAFTIVTIEGGQVAGFEVVENGHHEAGGCGSTVQRLIESGIETVIVGGIGMRPLQMLQSGGANVFQGQGIGTVGEAVAAMLRGGLPSFEPANACRGGGAHGPGHCGGH